MKRSCSPARSMRTNCPKRTRRRPSTSDLARRQGNQCRRIRHFVSGGVGVGVASRCGRFRWCAIGGARRGDGFRGSARWMSKRVRRTARLLRDDDAPTETIGTRAARRSRPLQLGTRCTRHPRFHAFGIGNHRRLRWNEHETPETKPPTLSHRAEYASMRAIMRDWQSSTGRPPAASASESVRWVIARSGSGGMSSRHRLHRRSPSSRRKR